MSARNTVLSSHGKTARSPTPTDWYGWNCDDAMYASPAS
jgi:hypothetical protein